ncbi:MAG: LPXTG cell wall anchor domain-containing protein [Lachnospiraceae bacterium]|nr:LPXTG cell wall anchor domain-containing protein [Lachnospiraceae bacterium]
MENSIFTQTAKFLRERRNNRRWRAIVICLAVIVVCGTAWVLSKKGQALTREEDILDCQIMVHEHDEGCYGEDKNLVCGKADYVFHEHDEACYDTEAELVCQLPEIKEHVHNSDCFEDEEILICQYEEAVVSDDKIPEEEQEYSVGSNSAGESELICGQAEHTHDDSCYEYEIDTTIYEETVKVLDCSQDEHQHSENCRDEEGELVCGRDEHSHEEDCYRNETISYEKEGEGQEVLICGQEEHVHSDVCYSDSFEVPDIPAEPDTDENTGDTHKHDDRCYKTIRRLVCNEKAAHIHDDSCYDDSGCQVCGAPYVEAVEKHVHDENCFKPADEADSDREYTRSFSNDDIVVTASYKKSANIPMEAKLRAELFTEESNSEYYGQRLRELEKEEGALEEEESLAMLLQILFYTDDEVIIPEDEISITVQFLNDRIYAEGDAIKVLCFTEDGIETVSGMSTDGDDSVTFEMNSFSELAFIAQGREENEKHSLIYEGEGYIVTVDPGEDTEIPEGAELIVEQITEENEPESYGQRFEELREAELISDGEETIAMLFRLGVFLDGKEILPKETMDVTVQFLNSEIYFESDPVKAVHFTEGGVEQLQAADIDDQVSTMFTVDELGELAFITDADIRSMTYEGEDFIVTVRFGKEAMIPEDAELFAERITEESDPEHFAEREEQLQDEITDELIALEVLMEIGFYVNEEEIEPQDTVDVKIRLLDKSIDKKDDTYKVVHFAEDGMEIFADAGMVEDEENSLSTTFQLDSFSEVAIVKDGKVIDSTTFRKAIQRAKDGDTVRIDADFTFTATKEDDGEADGSAKLKINDGDGAKKVVTLDLNGHKIELEGDYVTLINIEPNTELILTDSQAVEPVKIGENDTPTYSYEKPDQDSPGTLTYSVTESVSVGNGMTQETLCTYRVTGGAIIGNKENNNAALYLAGGTLTMENGIIFGNGGRAVQELTPDWASDAHPVLNLKGGYLVSNSFSSWGGGAICCENGTIQVGDGAVVSGNEADRGGGIYVKDSEITINGGYITNNTATFLPDSWSWPWFGCGGGIFVYNSQLTMSGGYITGNTAHMGGGGIGVDTYWQDENRNISNSALVLKAGYISANTQDGQRGEGGGIGIYDSSVITIGDRDGSSSNKLYITNNRLTQTTDWGGGGLFIGDQATAYLFYTLVTENSANGFGGGLAGCATGRIIESGNNKTQGVAVFGNTAEGSALSGGTSAKHQDHQYTANNPAFWNRGEDGKYLFQDYFSALYSYVDNNMLGGGSPNWDGSIDGERIDREASSWTSSYIIGLTAYSDGSAKEAAKNAAKVYITGNESAVHGGGIMCNGIMIVGDTQGEIEINSALALEAKKVLTDAVGQEFFDIEEGQFSFTVYEDEACMQPIMTAQNTETKFSETADSDDENTDGDAEPAQPYKAADILFDPLTFDLRRDLNTEDIVPLKEKTYTYYIKESISGDSHNSGIKSDERIYRLTVTVKQEFKEKFEGIDKYVDDITEICLDRKEGDSWMPVNTYYPESDEKHVTTISLTDPQRDDGAIFRNIRSSVTSISVRKEWNGIVPTDELVDSIHVALYQVDKGDADADGQEKTKTKIKEADLRPDNWSCSWDALSSDYDYEVVEEYVVYQGDESHYQPEEKFDVKYQYTTEDDKAIVTITNSPKTYGIELTKVGENKADEALTGAKFELLGEDGTQLMFKQHMGSFVYYDGTDTRGVSSVMVTDENGKIIITGLPAGRYTLRETAAPSGYKTVRDHTFSLGGDSVGITCPEKGGCTEAEFSYSGEKGILSLKLTDKEDKYELPKTGGFGTFFINIWGAILMCGVAVLMYIAYRRRRKGLNK